MPRRAASPARSEPELDILNSLYPGDDGDDHQGFAGVNELDIDTILNNPEGADDGGDEAFIALQQAASYRKASNLKGRTVKKGGGFQAMGMVNLVRQHSLIPEWILTNVTRPQCKPVKGDRPKGFLSSDSNPKENDPSRSRQKRCRRHG